MRKKGYLALLLVFVLLLCACTGPQKSPEPEVIPPAPQEPADTPEPEQPETEEPDVKEELPPSEPLPPAPPEEEPVPEVHSELYLPDYTVEQIIEYFEEVVLNVEYSDGTGDISLVQKWLMPIRYRYFGEPTQEDKLVLSNLFEQLNAIPGFPGIYAAGEGEFENLTISLLESEEFEASFSDVVNGEYAFGAVQFWYYTDTNELYTARIGSRINLDQEIRDSVLPEEVINMLGITDTVLRTDSITYQYSNENLALSEVDWILLKLLYHPEMQCGLDARNCAAVIKEIYY